MRYGEAIMETSRMKKNRVVMVYPHQGFSGTYVKHMPLSLLYASSELVKDGFDVKILDTRTVSGDWRDDLKDLLNDDTLCVGLSVMSGSPIKHAIQIGRFVKSINPDIPVVWGGPHATFYPETILRDEESCDFVISGYASESFHDLAKAMQAGEYPRDVNGACWRENGEIKTNPDTQKEFEFIDYRDIPYDLIDDFSHYGQLDQDKRIFSMYSAMGCPYQCTFCSSPAQYKPIKGKKWVPLKAEAIIDHVQYVVEKYDANYIYFIDDDSFPSLEHVEAIIDGIKERNLPVGIGFRGARINEIKRMSDEFLEKLASAGFRSQPPVAYRALDFLVEHGLVHRIEKLNAFVACNKPQAGHAPAFMICKDCHQVAETHGKSTSGTLGRTARAIGFDIQETVVEAEGICAACREV